MLFTKSGLASLCATAVLAVPAAFSAPDLVPATALGMQQPPLAYPIGTTSGSNVKVNGRLFEIDGKVQYFAGINAWGLFQKPKSDIETTIKELADTGYKVVRHAAFATVPGQPAPGDVLGQVYFHIVNSTGSYINFGADGLQVLDYVISLAEKYNIKLILPLLDNWSSKYWYEQAFGSTDTTFFTDSASRSAYKIWVAVVVSRYQKSNAIFSWELIDEVTCRGCESSVLTNWTIEMSQYVKSIDPDHLVGLGDDGDFSPAHLPSDDDFGDEYLGIPGIDFYDNLAVATIDYGTFHMIMANYDANYVSTFAPKFIAEHDLVGKQFKKPVVLESYGCRSDERPFTPGSLCDKAPNLGLWQDAVLKSGLAGDLIFSFSTTGISKYSSYQDDEYGIWYNTTKGSEYDILATQHIINMSQKSVS